ncbi:MAG: Glu/Leu/Phe/Val dehydrogenase [bacterium]|nr:Glu/Leu/Phe/Val dehydrogenase [bacterium]
MSSSFLESALAPIDKAAELLGLKADVVAALKRPERAIEATLRVRMDDGRIVLFPAWRVQWNGALGPYKGGIRYSPDANLDEVSALAALMTWKNSLMALPLGGGKGAVKVDPKTLSKNELERLSRAWARAFADVIGPEQDVPAPDVNTNAEIMAWMTDEYSKIAGKEVLGTFTGKPVEKGGSKGREVSTSYGGFVVLKRYLESQNGALEDRTIVIQGFGNVGSHIAEFLHGAGAKVVAISDSEGGIYKESGLDIPKVVKEREPHEKGGRPKKLSQLAETLGAEKISNETLLELPVDILIPAALESVIHEGNAKSIKGKVILEMANGPVTAEAEGVLVGRGIDVIPDIMANGGGVMGSYFEMLQNASGHYWGEEEVLNKIELQMTEAWEGLLAVRKRFGITYREAAFVRAVERVAHALEVRLP